MFWKFDLHTSSHLDTLLEREDLSLPELLDEEDVLQECKVVNRKLLDFLLQPPHLQAMVTWVTQEPPASGEERLRCILPLGLRLLTCVNGPAAGLVSSVLSLPPQQHSNASQSLCDIIRLSREQMIQVQDSLEPDQLLATLEKQETIEQLLSNMLEGEQSQSVIVSGIQVLLTLLEPRRPRSESVTLNNFFSSVDGQLDLLAQATLDSTTSSVGVLHALRPGLGRFHQLLLEPPELEPLRTTWGSLAPPLGNTRLHVVKLLASALSPTTVPTQDLFFHYMFNNFLHAQVELCVSAMLSAAPPSDSSLEIPAPNPVVKHLLQECRLVERILTSWEENDLVQSAGGPRKGYMGHLTRLANALVQNTEKGPNAEQLGQLLKELPGEQQEQWEAFVSGPLAETNKKNTVDLVSTHHLHSSSDDEDDRLKEFNFPEEAVLQQAFMDFQMQRMTSAFIDHFGFNDEEFGEQEESVNAATSPCTPQPNANLLEICYKDRIQQFDDEEDEEVEEEEEGQGSGESDEEDGAWQGSQLARGARRGQPPGVRSGGSTDSEEEDEEDEEDEDDGDGWAGCGGVHMRCLPPVLTPPLPHLCPGPSWTATFDPVPTDALTGPRDSGEKEPSSGLPAPSLRLTLGLLVLPPRSQDPTSPSAPQEATDGSKVAEPLAPCQALVSIGDLQATLRGTRSTPSSLDSATRDPATSVPAPGACQHPQTTEGEKSPEPLGLPQSQSAQALEPPLMPNGSAPGGPASLGSQ
uniref:Protein phosphatase 6 regulatory subunit 1 n=1 Tax=Ursus maritimus TaxID=29073 RepID=A0A452VKL2_URSMA